MLIKNYSDLTDSQKSEVRDIFYQTSAVKEFSSLELKQEFEYKYFGYYIENSPSLFLVACDDRQKVLGYICGLLDTFLDVDFVSKHKAFNIFTEQIKLFPSHLHINCGPLSQGRGVGSRLLLDFIKLLKENNSRGVHVVTSPKERNVGFYSKNVFHFQKLGMLGESEILFMGKEL